MRKSNTTVVKRIANERMEILYRLAEDSIKKNPDLSREYIKTLRKISMHYKISMPQKIKNKICKHCNTLLVPGLSAKVRLASKKGYIVYLCLNCKKENHLYY